MAMRRARRTAAGTTLVAVQIAGLLLELDAKGNVVRGSTSFRIASRRMPSRWRGAAC